MAARRGSAIGRVAVAALLAAGAWAALTGLATSSPESRPDLEGTYLPVHRPTGYLPPAIGGAGSDQSGRHWRRVVLEPLDLGSRPVVELCAETVVHTPCSRGDQRVVRRVGALDVSVALTGGSPRERARATGYWQSVRLVPGDRVAWSTRD